MKPSFLKQVKASSICSLDLKPVFGTIFYMCVLNLKKNPKGQKLCVRSRSSVLSKPDSRPFGRLFSKRGARGPRRRRSRSPAPACFLLNSHFGIPLNSRLKVGTQQQRPRKWESNRWGLHKALWSLSYSLRRHCDTFPFVPGTLRPWYTLSPTL